MTKILITGGFEGAVELIYGEQGTGMGREYYAPLLEVRFGNAVLEDKQKRYLMRCIPERYGPWVDGNGVEQGFEQAFPAKVKLVTEDVELDFERDFWEPYNFKMHKERAIKEWGQLTTVELPLAVARIRPYLRWLSRTGIAKAEAYNWLKKKYFKNDYDNL